MVTVSKSSVVVLVDEREILTSGSGSIITGDGRRGGDGGTLVIGECGPRLIKVIVSQRRSTTPWQHVTGGGHWPTT